MTRDTNSISIKYDPSENWVHITIVGDISADIAIKALRDATVVARREGSKRILVHTLDTQPVGSYESGFELSKNFARTTGVDATYRCAFYYSPDTYPPLRAKLMETVTQEEGGGNIRWFERLEEARAWLRQDTATASEA